MGGGVDQARRAKRRKYVPASLATDAFSEVFNGLPTCGDSTALEQLPIHAWWPRIRLAPYASLLWIAIT